MIANLSKKLEIRFWDFAIPMMSNNQKLRKLVNEVYRVFQDHELRQRTFFILSGSFAGFLCGCVIFFFIK
jgi:hypothetical protein